MMFTSFRTRNLASLCVAVLFSWPLAAQAFGEAPLLAEKVGRNELPAVAARLPQAPLVVDIAKRSNRPIWRGHRHPCAASPRYPLHQHFRVYAPHRLRPRPQPETRHPRSRSKTSTIASSPSPCGQVIVGPTAHRSRLKISGITGTTSRTTSICRRPVLPNS